MTAAAIVPELGMPIRRALLANQTIFNTLPRYNQAPTIFTRRPVPPDAPYPMIVVSSELSKGDRDGVDDQRPYITRDIAVYGRNDTSDHYRQIEAMADIVYNIFHRKRNAIYVDGQGWSVTSITCMGPIPAPTADDEVFVGRIVSVVTELGRAL